MKRTNLALALAAILLVSCGPQAENTPGELCENNTCSEAEINAPVEGSVEDPGYELTRFPYRGYRPPAFKASWGLRKPLYLKAVAYYNKNIRQIRNSRFIAVADFKMRSNEKRLFILDLETGKMSRHLVSHGKGSDPDADGFPTLFSNDVGSFKSSLGFYLTLGTYQGRNGYSMRLRGLEKTNSNAEARAVVMHSAKYVNEKTGVVGMSLGCTAVDPVVSDDLINRLKGESLLLVSL